MLLKEYLQEYGVKTKWFAEKIGISHAHLRQLLSGRQKIPQRLWLPIVQLSNYKVTAEDLEKNFIGYWRNEP